MQTKYECANCGPIDGPAVDLEDTLDLHMRLDVGCTVPAGECACGALCYEVKPPKKAPRIILEIRGGVLQEYTSDVPIEVHVIDWDNIREGDTDLEATQATVAQDFNKALAAIHEEAREIAGKHATT